MIGYRSFSQCLYPLAGAVLLASVFSPNSAHAAAVCSLAAVTNSYQAGVAAFEKGAFEKALTRFIPLAESGLGPAQRRLAQMYVGGKGVSPSASDAAFWSELAFRSGDREGRRMADEYRRALNESDRGALSQRLTVWKAARLDCRNGGITSRPAREGEALGGLSFDVEIENTVEDQLSDQVRQYLNQVIDAALKDDPSSYAYLAMVDGVSFYMAGRYHRYVGWHPQRKQPVLRVAANAVNDSDPKFLAKNMVLVAKRRLYDSLPDSKMVDPILRRVNGRRIIGSVYPDIRNGSYFRIIRQAYDMADRLPPDIRQYVDIIDEVHYNPISKEFKRSGTVDASAAYFNKILSSDDNNMMFVRRDVRFASPLFVLHTFVHEGTHAVQNRRARTFAREIPRLKHRWGELLSAGKHSDPETKALEKEIAEKSDYVERWFRGVQTDRGRIADINFECEATVNEIRAIRAVNGPPDVIRASGYLRVCPTAQRALNEFLEDVRTQNQQ